MGEMVSRLARILLVAGVGGLLAFAPARAQTTTFRTYHCADGTEFIVGFYPYDTHAYVQIDGGEITLPRQLAFSGTRYSGGGVTLTIGKTGRVTVKRARRPETVCDLD